MPNITTEAVFLENPVTTEIIRNALISAAKEMNESLFRSAYSPIIYESKDCSVGIFNANCEILGQSAGLPIFLGNLEIAIKIVADYFGGFDKFSEGDVYIMNDSYLTGTHLNDITMISPIFYRGKLVGFTANRAHWLDVGAKVPGYPNDSTECYQDGIRIGPTKLADAGVMRKDVAELICKNSRFFRNSWGDMNAQIAACRTGEKRFCEILDRFGLQTVENSIHDIFLQSELMESEEVRKLPEGVYEGEGFLDNDNHSDAPIRIKLKMTVKDGKIEIDLDGSNPQVRGSSNCGFAQTISACRVAYRSLILPDAPVTGGSFKPLSVKAPKASTFAAEEPASCCWYFTPLGLLIDLVVKVLEDAVPDMVSAAHYGDSMVVSLFGHDERYNNQLFLDQEATAGGWGGFAADDGQDGLINCVNGDFKNIPVEVFEINYPIKVNRYQLRKDSAGPGKNRGGNGIIRQYEVMSDDIFFASWFERSKTPAWGVCGGQSGAGPDVVIEKPGDNVMHVLKSSDVPVPKGTKITVYTGGGGGYGDAYTRDPEKVLRDVREGYLSAEHVREAYGVAVTDGMEIDRDETASLRNSGRTPR